jgi:hypothetical protein
VAVLLSVALSPGCSRAPEDGGGHDASPGFTTDASTQPEDAAVQDAAAQDAAPDATHTGWISTRNDLLGANAVGFTALAGFVVLRQACATRSVGSCLVGHCPMNTGQPEVHSAGRIHVSAANVDVSLDPHNDGSYPLFMDSTRLLWHGGQVIDVVAEGASVPAFQGSLTGPDPLTVISPEAPIDHVARARDLTFTWNAPVHGDVEVSLSTTDPGAMSSTLITCTFAGGSSEGTIPAGALMDLSASSGAIDVWVKSEATVTAGDWRVSLRADEIAVTSNGAAYSFNVHYD